MPRGDRGGKSRGTGVRCVAANCGNTNYDGFSLHTFPKDKNIRKKWTQFVKMKRGAWPGPTEYSALCSFHFAPNCFPFRLRFEIEQMGKIPKKVKLNPDAYPTKHAPKPVADKEPTPGTSQASSLSTDIPRTQQTEKRKMVLSSTTQWLEMLSPSEDQETQKSPPKKIRRGYMKREAARILADSFEKASKLTEDSSESNKDSFEAEIDKDKEVLANSLGTLFDGRKPPRRSRRVQTRSNIANRGEKIDTPGDSFTIVSDADLHTKSLSNKNAHSSDNQISQNANHCEFSGMNGITQSGKATESLIPVQLSRNPQSAKKVSQVQLVSEPQSKINSEPVPQSHHGTTPTTIIGTTKHGNNKSAKNRNIYFRTDQTNSKERHPQKTEGCNMLFSKIPTYINKFSDALFKLQQAGMLCDVELKGKDSSVYAHRLILLASGSSRFKSMLSDIQHWQYSRIVLDVSSFNASVLQSLVQFLYTGEIRIAENEVMNLCRFCKWLVLSDVCDLLNMLKSQCQNDSLSSAETSKQNIVSKKKNSEGKTENSFHNLSEGNLGSEYKSKNKESLTHSDTVYHMQTYSKEESDVLTSNVVASNVVTSNVTANGVVTSNIAASNTGENNSEEHFSSMEISCTSPMLDTDSLSNTIDGGTYDGNSFVVVKSEMEQDWTSEQNSSCEVKHEPEGGTQDLNSLTVMSLVKSEPEHDYSLNEVGVRPEKELYRSLNTVDSSEYNFFTNSNVQNESDNDQLKIQSVYALQNIVQNIVIKSEPT